MSVALCGTGGGVVAGHPWRYDPAHDGKRTVRTTGSGAARGRTAPTPGMSLRFGLKPEGAPSAPAGDAR